MSNLEIIRERLDQIITEQKINKAKLGEVAGVSAQAVNNWYKKGKISVSSAKAIYQKYGYSIEWILGGDESQASVTQNDGLTSDLFSNERDLLHKHRIDYYDVRAAAGLTGFENSDYPEIISSLYLTDEGMAQLVGKKSSDGICLVNVPTDSMEPTIRKGDIVFLDTKVNAYSGDGIYAFAIDGALFIKRIQKMIGGGYRMISDNEIYPPEQISDDVCENAKFIGRFIRTIHIEAVNL
jgi:putative transcriptional regulator|nr:MAG TPA: Repressor protein CI [Caudoviricetes sp.]